MLAALSATAQKWNRYGPGTRTQASAIYDPSTDQMIMFGGQHAPTNVDFHDVWTVKNVIASSPATANNLNWVSVNAVGLPPSDRFGHNAAYNPTSNRMVVFAGATGFPGPCVNDLWILANPNSVGGTPTWSQLSPTGTLPPVREGHVSVYDSKTNTMIVFGGTDCNGNYYNDLWILSNADGSTGTPKWTQAKATGTLPAARSQGAATYDSTNHVMTVFGGGAGGKTVFNDVWTLSNSGKTPVWKQLSPTGTLPTARRAHVAVYDSTNNRMTIHGGMNTGNVVQSDTWILSDANGIGTGPAWTQLAPTDTAPPRGSHTAIYDPVSDEMVIFGGVSQLPQTFTDDHVFVLTDANGVRSGPTWSQDGPVPRNHPSGVYDSVTDQMVAFGGQPSTGAALNDVWSEVSVAAAGQANQVTMNWAQIFPTGTLPAGRFGHSALYDSGSNRMMVFGGGTTATNCLNDLWILDDANSADGTPDWISLTASGTAPAARMNHVAVYDPTQNAAIIFGGTNCASGYLSDVWVLNNANGEGGTPIWTKLSPSGTGPAARESASGIYDPVNNILTIYAGDNGGTDLADAWTLSNANGQGGTPAWTLLTASGTPPAGRTGQSTLYDTTNNRMIMYGGINTIGGTHYLNDTWILVDPNDLGGTPAWSPLTVSGTAPLRRYHAAFYSSKFNSMVIFGGESQISQSPADDHIFVLSVANGLK
jgi:hypothetical protein